MKTVEVKIEDTGYGTNQIGTPYRDREGGGWSRDSWTNKDPGSRPEIYRVFALNKEDRSSVATTCNGNRQYHEKCSCCWLGFSHTTALHDFNAKRGGK